MQLQNAPVRKKHAGNPTFPSSLSDSVKYWRDTLGMKQLEEGAAEGKNVVLQFGPGQAKLVLEEVGGGKVDHKTAFGRIAFAVPSQVESAAS